jgi:hypothetical protein
MGKLDAVAKVALEAEAATPSVETIARALGEENLVGDPEGEWEVRAVDKYGAPDIKKAHLLRELMQDRWKQEARMAAAVSPGPPPIPAESTVPGRIVSRWSRAYSESEYWRDRGRDA